MESNLPNQKNETTSIIIVLLLIIVGGVFYGLDLYNRTKTVATVQPSEALGPVQVTD